MYADRQRLEDFEAHTLAPYALQSRHSRGRVHPESPPTYRTDFQRDRDRIIHSAAFRALEYKTQVFVNDEGDYYRTRLTHTLEVAQIGRTMARALGANEVLVEAICLAHDLGHPPFGHAGEDALNALMTDHGGFNHNHQSYRIVTALEVRYADWPGLNLTFEALGGLAKHETAYDLSRVAGLDPRARGSLEAQIANIADEMAYNAHDLDDGLQAGLLTPLDCRALDIWQVACARAAWDGTHFDDITRHHVVRELIGLQVDDVLAESTRRIQAANPQTSEDIQALPGNVVCHSDTLGAMNLALKRFLHRHMYEHYRIVRMARRAEHFLGALFEAYVRRPALMPPSARAYAEGRTVARTVADYLAGLTDRSAQLEYRRLFDPVARP